MAKNHIKRIGYHHYYIIIWATKW